jgi:hypothetical protein
VFVEIPIAVHNSPMAAALAAEIAPPSTATPVDYERCVGGKRVAVAMVRVGRRW